MDVPPRSGGRWTHETSSLAEAALPVEAAVPVQGRCRRPEPGHQDDGIQEESLTEMVGASRLTSLSASPGSSAAAASSRTTVNQTGRREVPSPAVVASVPGSPYEPPAAPVEASVFACPMVITPLPRGVRDKRRAAHPTADASASQEWYSQRDLNPCLHLERVVEGCVLHYGRSHLDGRAHRYPARATDGCDDSPRDGVHQDPCVWWSRRSRQSDRAVTVM